MKVSKSFLVLFTALPFLLVLLMSGETLKQGTFSHSFGCLASLLAIPVSNWYLLFKSKFQDDGWKVWALFGIIVGGFLSLASALA